MTGVPDAAPSPESIRRLRKEYALAGLSEAKADPDPFAQFGAWFDEALRADLREPNAMTVATATREGLPSARIVLLKSWDACGFVFYTNYEGQKGRELAENPVAALVFYWPEMERQIRIVGDVARVAPEESDRYFASRPLGSRPRGDGLPAERRDPGSGWVGSALAATRDRASRNRTDAPRELGRLSGRAALGRVLAGSAESSPRPPALPTRDGRRVAHRAPGPLIRVSCAAHVPCLAAG
jgi:hypothetical protein